MKMLKALATLLILSGLALSQTTTQIQLGTQVKGVLPPANGGTGVSTSVLYYLSPSTTLAALVSTVASAGGGTIVLGAGVYTSSTAILLADNNTCTNIRGSGVGTTTIKLTSSITTPFLFKDAASVPFGCTIEDVTVDANANAPVACAFYEGKAWKLSNLRCENSTGDSDLQIADYYTTNANRHTGSVTGITRTSSVSTATLSSMTGIAANQYITISGESDTTYNGTFLITSIAGSTAIYPNTGANGSATTGTFLSGPKGAGFYEFVLSKITTDNNLASFFTNANRTTNGIHFFPNATDGDVVAMVNRNAQVNGLLNDGGQIRTYSAHAYGFDSVGGDPLFFPLYSMADTGNSNSYISSESDGPQTSAFHLSGKGTQISGGIAQDLSAFPAANLATIEAAAANYGITNMGCTGMSGGAGNLITYVGTPTSPGLAPVNNLGSCITTEFLTNTFPMSYGQFGDTAASPLNALLGNTAVNATPFFLFRRNGAQGAHATMSVIQGGTQATLGGDLFQTGYADTGIIHDRVNWTGKTLIGPSGITSLGGLAVNGQTALVSAAGTPTPITNIAITSNVLTVTTANTFIVGQTVFLRNLVTATFLNNQEVTIASVSSTQFTANYTHANYASAADTGYVILQVNPYVTNVALTSNVVTVSVNNNFVVGQQVMITGLVTATFLNDQVLTVATVSSSQFTASFTHANYATAADAGGTAALAYTLPVSTGTCASGSNPAPCGSALSGAVIVAIGATSVVVNTTSVTATSKIFIQHDPSLGACNAAFLAAPPQISARTAGTSFTIAISAAPVTTAACFSFVIQN